MEKILFGALLTLRGQDKPIGISEYELTRALPDNLNSVLPIIEEIEAELSAGLQGKKRGRKNCETGDGPR